MKILSHYTLRFEFSVSTMLFEGTIKKPSGKKFETSSLFVGADGIESVAGGVTSFSFGASGIETILLC